MPTGLPSTKAGGTVFPPPLNAPHLRGVLHNRRRRFFTTGTARSSQQLGRAVLHSEPRKLKNSKKRPPTRNESTGKTKHLHVRVHSSSTAPGHHHRRHRTLALPLMIRKQLRLAVTIFAHKSSQFHLTPIMRTTIITLLLCTILPPLPATELPLANSTLNTILEAGRDYGEHRAREKRHEKRREARERRHDRKHHDNRRYDDRYDDKRRNRR